MPPALHNRGHPPPSGNLPGMANLQMGGHPQGYAGPAHFSEPRSNVQTVRDHAMGPNPTMGIAPPDMASRPEPGFSPFPQPPPTPQSGAPPPLRAHVPMQGSMSQTAPHRQERPPSSQHPDASSPWAGSNSGKGAMPHGGAEGGHNVPMGANPPYGPPPGHLGFNQQAPPPPNPPTAAYQRNATLEPAMTFGAGAPPSMNQAPHVHAARVNPPMLPPPPLGPSATAAQMQAAPPAPVQRAAPGAPVSSPPVSGEVPTSVGCACLVRRNVTSAPVAGVESQKYVSLCRVA